MRSLGIALGIALLESVAFASAAYAAPPWRITHFGACASEDVIMQADGAWWWFEQGRNIQDPVRFGGSYVTSTRQINSRDYGSHRQAFYDVTVLKLKKADGSWVDGFYLPIELVDQICGSN